MHSQIFRAHHWPVSCLEPWTIGSESVASHLVLRGARIMTSLLPYGTAFCTLHHLSPFSSHLSPTCQRPSCCALCRAGDDQHSVRRAMVAKPVGQRSWTLAHMLLPALFSATICLYRSLMQPGGSRSSTVRTVKVGPGAARWACGRPYHHHQWYDNVRTAAQTCMHLYSFHPVHTWTAW